MIARIGRVVPSWKRAAVETLTTDELFSLYERIFGFLDPVCRRRLMAVAAAQRETRPAGRSVRLAA